MRSQWRHGDSLPPRPGPGWPRLPTADPYLVNELLRSLTRTSKRKTESINGDTIKVTHTSMLLIAQGSLENEKIRCYPGSSSQKSQGNLSTGNLTLFFSAGCFTPMTRSHKNTCEPLSLFLAKNHRCFYHWFLSHLNQAPIEPNKQIM